MAPLSAILALVLLGGEASAPRSPEPPEPELPWLRGFPATVFADEPSLRAEVRLHAWQAPDDDCPTSAAGALQLIVDVAPPAGAETVLASYTAGIVVLDAHGRKIAAAPAFACRGSVDRIEYIAAAGDLVDGEPVLAVAAAAGGRAERTIWLFLFALRGGGLTAIFAGPVEDWHGEVASTGEVALQPGGKLRHRAPNGAITLWAYDRDARRYVMREVLRGPIGTAGPAV